VKKISFGEKIVLQKQDNRRNSAKQPDPKKSESSVSSMLFPMISSFNIIVK